MLQIILFALSVNGAHAQSSRFSSWTQACAAAEAVVAEGDLIFLDMPDYLFRSVAEATNTWTSHVGVAFRDEGGEWVVAESTIPLSKEVPLCAFLQTSAPYRFQINRLKRQLSNDEVHIMHATARSLIGRLYGLGFNFDSRWLFCSKFAHMVYASIGVEAGRVQTFRELLDENPNAGLTFWRFWFLGRIPWERRTVTPGNQLKDAQFELVLAGENR